MRKTTNSRVLSVWTASPFNDHDSETLLRLTEAALAAGHENGANAHLGHVETEEDTWLVIWVGDEPTPKAVLKALNG